MTDLDTGAALVNGTEADASDVNAKFDSIETHLNTTGVHVYQAGTVETAALEDGAVTNAKVTSVAASKVTITDAAGDFTATDVEGAIAEIQTDIESISAGGIADGSVTPAKLSVNPFHTIKTISMYDAIDFTDEEIVAVNAFHSQAIQNLNYYSGMVYIDPTDFNGTVKAKIRVAVTFTTGAPTTTTCSFKLRRIASFASSGDHGYISSLDASISTATTGSMTAVNTIYTGEGSEGTVSSAGFYVVTIDPTASAAQSACVDVSIMIQNS